jgi:hypothetical protein
MLHFMRLLHNQLSFSCLSCRADNAAWGVGCGIQGHWLLLYVHHSTHACVTLKDDGWECVTAGAADRHIVILHCASLEPFFSDCQTCCQSLFSLYRRIKSSGLVRGRSIRTRWANASSKSVHFPSLSFYSSWSYEKGWVHVLLSRTPVFPPWVCLQPLQLDHYTGCLVIMFHTG